MTSDRTSDAPMERFKGTLVSGLGIPFVDGNDLTILKNGVEIFPAMLDAIGAAERTVDFLTFVYWDGEIADTFARALGDAAQRGVRVRVLLDAIGAMRMSRALIGRMEECGVDVVWFRPPPRWTAPGKASSRTHRKILICDDEVAFTGGVGIGAEWEGNAEEPGSWRETHFRLRGPIVSSLGSAFLEDWLEASEDTPAPPPPAPTTGPGTASIQLLRSRGGLEWSDRATLLWLLLSAAEKRVRISTPYFVLDETTVEHFVSAAQRGVDVSVLVPGPHIDHRVAQVAGAAWYEELLEAGVRLYEYQPTMIHQKVAVYDDAVASIGSANLNQRSRLQDHEVQLIVADRPFAEALSRMLDDDFALAEPVRPGAWKRRPLHRRVAEALTRPFRRQL